MKLKNERNVEMFLNRLNWKTNTGDIEEFQVFQVDVYKFRIKKGLSGDTARKFTEYLRTLPMTETRSVMKIFVWLYQHDVKFRLVFAWNPRLPARYNLDNLGKPRQVRKLLLSRGHDDLMSCPLDKMDKEEE